MSLVPIAALGEHYGVSVRAIDSIIRLACIIHKTDYWRRGRTLDKLGIDQLERGRADGLRRGRDARLHLEWRGIEYRVFSRVWNADPRLSPQPQYLCRRPTMVSKSDLIKISDWLWEIPQSYRSDMRVPARLYADEQFLENALAGPLDRAARQHRHAAGHRRSRAGHARHSPGLRLPDRRGGGGALPRRRHLARRRGLRHQLRRAAAGLADQLRGHPRRTWTS